MKVTVAETAGFCFGVKRAVDTVYRQIEESPLPVYTYGPIIHNEVVVKELAEKGVHVIRDDEELTALAEGTVIIRSHGVSKAVLESLDRPGIRLVDATCPFVEKIHRIAAEETRAGKTLVIAGNPEHPEVIGIKGWAEGPCYVIQSAEDFTALNLDKSTPVALVAQTTFDYKKFEKIVEILASLDYNIQDWSTVCKATEARQTEARNLAGEVDAMIVIGDIHSSNTQKLYEICKHTCKCSYFIETLVDLETQPFQSFCHVGITAGASTPKHLIEEVQNYVRCKF
ncbi:MAG: 4-hydroxy-3-methylbut-2-enyl diphosphate reductase [Eubacterium sp.]|nr:4-hydroxy-3-methylbut-2-enyl diphosphate reductase [Eubacterium sp.]